MNKSSGKTLIRIFRNQEGGLSYNIMSGDETNPLELVGLLERLKQILLEYMPDNHRDINKEEVKKIRNLFDSNENAPKLPNPPLIIIKREGDIGRKCPYCESSLKLKWLFFKTKKCIQPECKNYYEQNS